MAIRFALVMLVLAACAPANSEPPRSSAPATEARTDTSTARVTGTVRVVGSAPVSTQVVVQPEAGSSAQITGPLAAEIGRLSGAEVEITGEMDGGTIEAAGYSVRSVDGRPVVMGIVEPAPSGGLQLRLGSGEVVALEGAAERLRVGQKVWVQGPTSVRVQSYGVIRP